jgi:hypothetical protein
LKTFINLASTTVQITRNNSLAERMSTVRPLLQFSPLLTNNTVYPQGYDSSHDLLKVFAEN